MKKKVCMSRRVLGFPLDSWVGQVGQERKGVGFAAPVQVDVSRGYLDPWIWRMFKREAMATRVKNWIGHMREDREVAIGSGNMSHW